MVNNYVMFVYIIPVAREYLKETDGPDRPPPFGKTFISISVLNIKNFLINIILQNEFSNMKKRNLNL